MPCGWGVLRQILPDKMGWRRQPCTSLAEIFTYYDIHKKYHQRGLSSGQKLRDETEKMEKEFYNIMNDLEQRRNNKNMDWYHEQLNNDYSNMRKNHTESTT